MDYLPIFCRLQGRDCLLVGGGEVAERKARLLIETGAVLRGNALAFTQQFHAWAKEGRLTLCEGAFDENLLNGCWLVIAATDDPAVNQQICEAANARRIFCNIVDAPKAASFIMPAIIDRSPLVVAVASSGMAPVLSRLLREKFEALLPQYLGNLVAHAGKLRRRVKKHFAQGSERRRFWEKLFQNDRLAQALAHSDEKAVEAMTDQLFEGELSSQGEVALVGAGPGSPDLLTLKGLQKIQQADVIVHDRLITAEMLSLARRDAERIFVGKCAGHHCVPQAEINQLLCRYAKQGKRVVRLKGGDPFIFGRGGEELEALCSAGIPISVVPGITAASGCAAYAGIPLTHRDYAQSVRLVTGHFKSGGDLDWQHLVSEEETLVFYMGVAQAEAIAEKLMMFGMPADMPVAVIEKGTTAQQRVLIGELSQLGVLAEQVTTPALIIIGEVVKLSEKFNWFSEN